MATVQEEYRETVAAFRRLGIDEIDALDMAEAHVSPSYVRHLVEEKGCPPDQVKRLVL